jgi:hypothetical protein
LAGETDGAIEREEDDLRRVGGDRLKDGVDIDGAGGGVKFGAAAQGAGEKLGLHYVGIGD